MCAITDYLDFSDGVAAKEPYWEHGTTHGRVELHHLPDTRIPLVSVHSPSTPTHPPPAAGLKLVSYPEAGGPRDIPWLQVPSWAARAARSLRGPILEQLRTHYEPEATTVHVTGRGPGGALALLLALEISWRFPDARLVTFDQPPVLRLEAAASCSAWGQLRSFTRVLHEEYVPGNHRARSPVAYVKGVEVIRTRSGAAGMRGRLQALEWKRHPHAPGTVVHRFPAKRLSFSSSDSDGEGEGGGGKGGGSGYDSDVLEEVKLSQGSLLSRRYPDPQFVQEEAEESSGGMSSICAAIRALLGACRDKRD